MYKSPYISGLDVMFIRGLRADHSSNMVVHLNPEGLLVVELYPIADAVKAQLSFVSEVSPEVSPSDVLLRLRLTELGYGATYLNRERREKLSEVLRPTYTRLVGASAQVKRTEAGAHTTTLVTIRVHGGDGLDAQGVEVSGVERFRLNADRMVLVCSMEHPAANDDHGDISRVVASIAEELNAMVTGSVHVTDDNPDAALDPAFDYRPDRVVVED